MIFTLITVWPGLVWEHVSLRHSTFLLHPLGLFPANTQQTLSVAYPSQCGPWSGGLQLRAVALPLNIRLDPSKYRSLEELA